MSQFPTMPSHAPSAKSVFSCARDCKIGTQYTPRLLQVARILSKLFGILMFAISSSQNPTSIGSFPPKNLACRYSSWKSSVYTIPGTKLKVSSSSGMMIKRLLFVFPSPSIPVPNSSSGMSLDEKISKSSSLSKGCIRALTVIMTERIVSSGPPL